MESRVNKQRQLHRQTREVIINIYIYFLKEAYRFKKSENKEYFQKVQGRVAKACGVTKATVRSVVFEKDRNRNFAYIPAIPKYLRPKHHYTTGGNPEPLEFVDAENISSG